MKVVTEIILSKALTPRGGGGGTPYDGLYGEAPPERGIFFKLQEYTGGIGLLLHFRSRIPGGRPAGFVNVYKYL